MTREQTLAAAEVMRRAAEGEPVEARSIGAHYWHPASDPSWTWNTTQYRIAEPPPHGPSAHNPDKLTPLQVETHLGWRLLDRDEIGLNYYGGKCDRWLEGRWRTGNHGHNEIATYRTKLTREELAEARGIKPKKEPQVFTFSGFVQEAGDSEEGQPRVIIATTRDELTGRPIPFYRPATITITEVQP